MYRKATRVSPAMALAGLDGMMYLSLAALCWSVVHVVRLGFCLQPLRRGLFGHTVLNDSTIVGR